MRARTLPTPARPVERLLAQLEGVRRAGRGWVARCPVPGHGKGRGDLDPSLSVTETPEGHVLLHCFAGCSFREIVEAVGLRPEDLRPQDPSHNGDDKPQRGGLTVAELARAKKLAPELLGRYVEDLPGGGVRFIYRDEDGHSLPVTRTRRALDGERGFRWGTGDKAVPFGLDRLPQARERGRLILCEGETDALTAWCHGLQAVGLPGADTVSCLEPQHLQGIARLWVLREPDAGGRAFVLGIARRLRELKWQGEARVLELDGHKDLSELHLVVDGDRRAFRAALLEAARRSRPLYEVVAELEREREQAAPAGGPRLEVVPLAEVTPEPVVWLWPGFLPQAELVLLAGDPGIGKSFVAAAVAAAVSTGAPFPGHTERREPADVIFLAFEDDPARVLRQRLEAMGADLRRIHVVRGVRQGEALGAVLLPDHVDPLRRLVQETGARLVAIDPLVGALPGALDTHRQAAVRAALGPLQRLAHETDCTVLAIAHLRKADGPALYRPNASVDFVAVPRVVLVVGKDPDDPSRRALAVLKTNLGELPEAVAFRIVDGRLEWLAERLRVTAEEILAAPLVREEPAALAEADEFLRTMLADGPRPAKEVLKAAEQAGIAEKTLRRAKERLGVRVVPDKDERGQVRGWRWDLPGWPDGQPDGQPHRGRFGHLDPEAREALKVGRSVQMAKPAGDGHLVQTPPERAFRATGPGGHPEALDGGHLVGNLADGAGDENEGGVIRI